MDSSHDVESIIDQVRTTSDFVTKAKLINHLKKNRGLRTNKIAKLLSMTPSYVCNVERISHCSVMVIDGYFSKSITPSHLMVLGRIKDASVQERIFEQVLAKTLSVGQTEALVREHLYDVVTDGEKLDAKKMQAIVEIFKKIDPELDVALIQTQIKAKLTIGLKGNAKKTTASLKKLASKLSTIS